MRWGGLLRAQQRSEVGWGGRLRAEEGGGLGWVVES